MGTLLLPSLLEDPSPLFWVVSPRIQGQPGKPCGRLGRAGPRTLKELQMGAWTNSGTFPGVLGDPSNSSGNSSSFFFRRTKVQVCVFVGVCTPPLWPDMLWSPRREQYRYLVKI